MRLQVFYVENQQIYPFAEVDQGYKLADSTQIYSVYKDGMGFSSGEMYDFAELYEKAEEELESLQKEWGCLRKIEMTYNRKEQENFGI